MKKIPSHTAHTVLFVSRRDTLRSRLASACLEHLAGERFRCFTAGRPGETGERSHPVVRDVLQRAGMRLEDGVGHPWSHFTGSGKTRIELVVLLDAGMAPLFPTLPGFPELALWSFPDLLAEGEPQPAAALQILLTLRRRLEILASLPLRHPDRNAIRSDLRDLAHR